MASHYSQQDLETIVDLKDNKGLTHSQIAEKLNRLDKAGKPNARAIMHQYKKAKAHHVSAVVNAKAADASSLMEESVVVPNKDKSSTQEPPIEEVIARPDQLNELSKRQRAAFLRSQMNVSARSRHAFDNILNASEQEIFLEEYFAIVNEEESITAAEEQQLFSAILHLVLAYRAAARDEQCFQRSPMSGYTGIDAAPYIDLFKKDYQDNMAKYDKAMKSMNLSREQRVKNLQRQGTSFLDFAEKYSKTDEQAKAADEIMKLEEMSQDELARLQANGWLVAGGLLDNNQPSFDGDRTLAVKDNYDQQKAAAFIGTEEEEE